ncbi:hypothetical protein OIU84_018133 [Salix udensis]|uniref:Uncharacterized protein n=1 Tax=Salix udensis TaxID=889485 RepID=A0AAD6PMK2_9ROSI|nr:hypothetical protein OIU84_018133 [Salix udensis]
MAKPQHLTRKQTSRTLIMAKLSKSHESQYFTEDFDSTCSTPYVSAPSSPGRPGSGPVNGGFFYSCPASPMHFAITSSAAERRSFASSPDKSVPIGYEFEFSAKIWVDWVGSNRIHELS